MKNIKMSMTGIALVLMAVSAMVSCKKEKEPVIPTVTVSAMEAGINSISFKISSVNAETVKYDVMLSSEQQPSAEQIMANGKTASASSEEEYTVNDLAAETEYTIYAVAQSATGHSSAVASAKMKTSAYPAPGLTITPGEVTETSVKFTIASNDAMAAKYVCVAASAAVPSAEEIMASGKTVDVSSAKEYTEEGLEADTEYVVAAVAKGLDDKTLSDVVKATIRTDKPEPVIPSVEITSVEVELNKATVNYTTDKAEKSWIYVLKASEAAPSAETVAAQGNECESTSGQMEFTLEYAVEYIAYMAAQSSDGSYSSVASKEFVTEEEPVKAPEVGDFYYSDGTYSSGSADPEAGKTVIGVVYKVGRDETDANAYKCTDGTTALDNVKAYVVSLTDVVYETGDVFKPYIRDFEWEGDFNAAGTSTDVTVFNGYSNTLSIKAKAEELHGELNFDWNNYKACYVAYIYWNEAVPAPAASTGWYMPSMAELSSIVLSMDIVDASILKAGGSSMKGYDKNLWSSNEYPGTEKSEVYAMSMDPSSFGSEVKLKKSRVYPVRTVLVF